MVMTQSGSVCPFCQKRFTPGFVYCPLDGTELVSENGSKRNSVVSSPNVSQRNQIGQIGLRVFLGAVAIAGLCIAVWWMSQPFELNVVFDVSRGVQAGDSVWLNEQVVGRVLESRPLNNKIHIRIVIFKEFLHEIGSPSLFFALQEIPMVSSRGIYIMANHNAGKKGRRYSHRDTIQGETSQSRYLSYLAQKSGKAELQNLSDTVEGFLKEGSSMIPQILNDVKP